LILEYKLDTRMKTIHKQNIFTAALACALVFTTISTPAQDTSSAEAQTIAKEAYIYFYPLVLMDVSRKHFTNIEAGKMFARGPMNTFSHARTFPPVTFRGATHANFDTLYSVGWLDLTKEPVIISVPDTHGGYYLLQLLDMWTDSFAGVGKRTTGTRPGDFAISTKPSGEAAGSTTTSNPKPPSLKGPQTIAAPSIQIKRTLRSIVLMTASIWPESTCLATLRV
jgi:hypothetical protein